MSRLKERNAILRKYWTTDTLWLRRLAQEKFGQPYYRSRPFIVVTAVKGETLTVWFWEVVAADTGHTLKLRIDDGLSEFSADWTRHHVGRTHWPVIAVCPTEGMYASEYRPLTEDQKLELTIAALSGGMTLEFPGEEP